MVLSTFHVADAPNFEITSNGLFHGKDEMSVDVVVVVVVVGRTHHFDVNPCGIR